MAVKIGFEDETEVQFDEDGEPIIKHGDGYEEREAREKEIEEVYLPPNIIEELKKDFESVVVYEYGDDYHLTEKEREETNQFYSAFKIVSKMKKKYRELDAYVRAVRQVLECLDMVAEKNGIYEPNKFKRMFLKDQIYIVGLNFPKFIGKERKIISWDYLTDFILSDEDSKNILPKKVDTVYSYDELTEEEDYLFDEGELEKITAPLTDEQIDGVRQYFDKDEDLDRASELGIAYALSKKQVKKLVKTNPEFLYMIKEYKKNHRGSENLQRLALDLAMDDLDEIAKYDKIHGYVSSSDIPEFKGDLTNGKDYKNYMRDLEEYEDTQVKVNYNGRMKTKEQIREIELKQVLEEAGWNIRNLYENKEKEKKLKIARKEDKKREDKLRKKLVNIEKRRKRKMNELKDEENSKSKSNKKDKKKKKKGEKKVERAKKEAEQDIDEFLLAAAQRTEGNMKEYAEEALDFDWDNIMNGGEK